MLINRFQVVVIASAAVTAILTGSSPALAADPEGPVAVSAELSAAEGAGCNQPAVEAVEGGLRVVAQTGADVSLDLSAADAAGETGIAVQCVVHVRYHFDRPTQFKPTEYPLSGYVNTAAGTVSGHNFESSFDGVTWYGQRSLMPPGSSGPFYQSGITRGAPWSACGTEAGISFRVGLSLTADGGLDPHDRAGIDAPNGSTALVSYADC